MDLDDEILPPVECNALWLDCIKMETEKEFRKVLNSLYAQEEKLHEVKANIIIYRLGDYGDSDTFFVIGDENTIVLSRKIHLSWGRNTRTYSRRVMEKFLTVHFPPLYQAEKV